MASTRVFRSGGRVTRITRSGRDDGPGYVLVHGIGMAHEYWSDVAAELGRSGTVYALDLPGFGDAPQLDEPLTMRGAGDLLADLVRAEGIADPVLVGHSAGAQAVAEAAAWHPELFERIVLIAPTVNPRERSAGKQALRLLQDLSLTHPKVLGLGVVSYAKAGVSWYLESLPPVIEHRVELTLPNVAARTLVIRGERDRLVPREWAERVASLVGDGRYAEVPGRGHETMITAGARVANLIAAHARGEAVGRVVGPADGAVVVPARRRPPLAKIIRWWALDYLYAGWRQLAVLGAWKPPAKWSRGDTALPTIVLLPGVYEHWSFLRLLGDALNARGHRVRVVHGLGANLLDIPETAARVSRALARVSIPAAGQVLVAHSKGGLVAKRMLLDDDAPSLGLLGMVAIATPFGGSIYSRFMFDRALREFDPDAPIIVELADGVSVNSRIVSVFGPFDPHVPKGSALDGATNVQVPVAGHFRVLGATETVDAVVTGIRQLADADATADAADQPAEQPGAGQSSSNGAA